MTGYLLYSLLIFVGFLFWIALFLGMRKGISHQRDLAGYFLIGPFHSYLKKRNYTLTTREMIGWGVVLLVMLMAPWLTWFLEKPG